MEKRQLIEFRRPGTGEVITFKTRKYYVTDTGQVWNDDLNRLVAQYENNYGYLAVSLTDDSCKQHTGLYVHALVASCFLRLLERGESVHHINHDKNDNRLENLEIIDVNEHVRMHWKNGTYGGVAEKFSKQVAQLSLDGQLIKVWPSTRECKRNGFDHGSVARCCNGKRATHKGYRWQWMEDYLAKQPTVTSQPVQLELNFS